MDARFTKEVANFFAPLSSDRRDCNTAGRGFTSSAPGDPFVQRVLILRGGWHQPPRGTVKAHLIAAFAARAPACAFILCWTGRFRGYTVVLKPDALCQQLRRVHQRSPSFFLVIGRVASGIS